MNITGTMDILTTAAEPDGAGSRSLFTSFLICCAAIVSQILTIGGNILVLLSFKVERRLRKPSNYFLFSLAVADLIIGLFSMPVYSLYLLLQTWPFGTFVCDLWISIDYACSEVSVLNLIMISVDRLWSVKSPAKYRNNMNFRRALIMIIPTWIAPTLLYFTSIMGWAYITGTKDPRMAGSCYVPFMENSPVFMTVSTIFVYWVPLAAMFIMYVMIFQIIRNLGNNKKRDHNSNQGQRPGNPLPYRSGPDHVCVIQPIESTVLETEAHLGVTNDGTTTTTASTNCSDINQFPQKPLALPGKMPDIESETEPVEDTSSSSRHIDNSGYTRDYQKAVLKSVEVKRDRKSGKFKSGMLSTRTKRRGKSQRGERHSKSERKATKTLTFILGAFFVTWSPYSTIVIILAWYQKPENLTRFYHFSYYLCYINSTINPLCYAFANELFRNTFYKILSGKACKS